MSATSPQSSAAGPRPATSLDTEFNRGLGLYDSTMVVVGSMIGSGIFIVSADMARNIGSPGWLLAAWVLTGLLTVVGALSYGELAARVGAPGAARAVGTANATNPICLIIPCHRVIRTGGALGGYGFGLERKRWLLAHEAAAFEMLYA